MSSSVELWKIIFKHPIGVLSIRGEGSTGLRHRHMSSNGGHNSSQTAEIGNVTTMYILWLYGMANKSLNTNPNGSDFHN